MSSSINTITCGRSKATPLHIEELSKYVINKIMFSKNLKNELFILVGDGTRDFQMEKIGVWDNIIKKYILCVNLQCYGNTNQPGYWIEDLLFYDKKTFIWTNISPMPSNITLSYPIIKKQENDIGTNEPIYNDYKYTDVFTTINENDETDKTVFIEIYDMVLYKTKDDILYVKTNQNKRIKIGFWDSDNLDGNNILFDDDNEADEYKECDRYDSELGF